MLSKAQIESAAEALKFRVTDVEPAGIGRRVNITLNDTRTDQAAMIGVWPETTEDDLLYLLTRAAFELRGAARLADGGQHEWLM